MKIRELKRFILEYGREQGWTPAWAQAEPNGHKVAVIGAGPSGLAAAAELLKAGYDVTVYEKETTAGGALRYGIPDYAGHKAVLAEEVENLKACGVKFQFGCAVSNADELKAEGFEKVFAAVGANRKAPSPIEGEDAREFLYKVNSGDRTEISGRVAVIGSGFAAVDAARCAVRLGAESVTILNPGNFSKRSGEAEAWNDAREEGVVLMDRTHITYTAPGGVRFEKDGADMLIKCDQIIVENKYVADYPHSGEDYMITARQKVTNVISAIAAGKNAAAAIDKAIRGDKATLAPIGTVKTVSAEAVRQRTGYLKRDTNPVSLKEKAENRTGNFDAYKRVMTAAEAVKEAARCLNCGCGEGCQLCKTICTDFAPEIADTDTMHIRSEKCVACGMCFNRCPNGNIEMVNLGIKV